MELPSSCAQAAGRTVPSAFCMWDAAPREGSQCSCGSQVQGSTQKSGGRAPVCFGHYRADPGSQRDLSLCP